MSRKILNTDRMPDLSHKAGLTASRSRSVFKIQLVKKVIATTFLVKPLIQEKVYVPHQGLPGEVPWKQLMAAAAWQRAINYLHYKLRKE